MSVVARLVSAVRTARAVADVSRLLDAAEADTTTVPPHTDRRPDPAPRPSVVPNRAQLRAGRRHGVRAFAMQWHGQVPPVWQQLDGSHFDVLHLTRLRAERARHAAVLDRRAQLHAGTPCATGVTVCACARRDGHASAHGPVVRVARRRVRRADAERVAQLYRAARALSRLVLPAPPHAVRRAGRTVALTVP